MARVSPYTTFPAKSIIPKTQLTYTVYYSILGDTRPLPPVNPDPAEDEKLFEKTDPVVDPPISVDHGLNLKVGAGSFINFDTTILDTCLITIGERVLFGPHIRIYGATHPMDPAVRRGLEGPEGGKEIHIEDDVWVGGSVIILAGVRIGRGSTVGAGSVVTRVRFFLRLLLVVTWESLLMCTGCTAISLRRWQSGEGYKED